MAGFFARSAPILFLSLACSSLGATTGEMTSSMLIGNARIDIMIEGNTQWLPAKDILRWVKLAAESVTAYYGHFPLPQVLIRITPFDGSGISNGMTLRIRSQMLCFGSGVDDATSGSAPRACSRR